MSFNLIMLFLFTVIIASIIPGPSMLLALTHGMRYGAKKTIASAMGNVSVTLVQASISLAGLGTILFSSEIIFQLIKWAGAVYLIYMGISMLRSSNMLLSPTPLNQSSKWYSLREMYMQSVFVTAGNPKAIIFFTAVFPQFINPDAPYLSQFFIIYAIGGQKIASLFSNTSVMKYIQKTIGGTFIGAGIGLAVSNR